MGRILLCTPPFTVSGLFEFLCIMEGHRRRKGLLLLVAAAVEPISRTSSGGLSQPRGPEYRSSATSHSQRGWVSPTSLQPSPQRSWASLASHPQWHPYSLCAPTDQLHFSCTQPLRVASCFPSNWGPLWPRQPSELLCHPDAATHPPQWNLRPSPGEGSSSPDWSSFLYSPSAPEDS